MVVTQSIATDVGSLELATTAAADGDLSLASPLVELEARRQGLQPGPWTWLRQVHGTKVVEVTGSQNHQGAEADGAFTNEPGRVLSVLTADCAAIGLVGHNGFALVHGGWRGLDAGIVDEAAAHLRSSGARPLTTVLGPCIHPTHYEFGADDLRGLIARFGQSVAAETESGRPALSLPALVAAACDKAGWPAPRHRLVDPAAGPCTSNPSYFSHRVRSDTGRQAMMGTLIHD